TPLEPGSPYCPVAFGFLHLARRGVFLKSPKEAWGTKSFEKREGVAEWPLFCQVDTSTQSLKVRSYMYISVQLLFKTSVLDAGLDGRDLSHKSYTSGFATRFVLTAAMENGGRFADNQVDQLRRLGGGQSSRVLCTYTSKK
ncbi:unnamed protein product, partial [Porites evermanni]